MADSFEANSTIAESSLPLLLHRLQRLEFLLTGKSDSDGLPQGAAITGKVDESVTAKLRALQLALEKLRKLDGTPGSVVRDVETLGRLANNNRHRNTNSRHKLHVTLISSLRNQRQTLQTSQHRHPLCSLMLHRTPKPHHGSHHYRHFKYLQQNKAQNWPTSELR